MKKEEVKTLLEKYFEGETSLQEEDQLKEFFSGDSEFKNEFKEAPLFLALMAEKEIQLKKISFNPSDGQNATHVFSARTVIKWAASIIIILGGISLLIPWNESDETQKFEYVDSYSDPEEAFLEARKALAMVSSKINSGKQDVAVRVSKFNEVLPIKN
jgi:hypothetical protein